MTMPVIEHPERVKACQRGEIASRMVTVACELACLVREGDREAIGEFLADLGPAETQALLIVQSAMIPVEIPAGTLLSWVTWDEYGRPLPGPVLEAPVRRRRHQVELEPCGTYAAFRRHEHRGELIDDDCRAAAARYWADRYRARKAARAKASGGRAGRVPEVVPNAA